MKNKRVIRKIALLLVFVLIIGNMLCGCSLLFKAFGNTPVETSKKYMVGFDYSSYKDVFGMAPVITCTVRYDKSVDAVFYWRDQNGKQMTRTLNFPLTDKQYNNIYMKIDTQEIYYLDPECSDPQEVMDGGSCWLFVYGPDDSVIKECGGFSPTSKRFHEIRRTMFDNLPEKLVEVYSEFENICDERLGNEDDSQFNERFLTLFDETYAEFIED